MNRFFVTLVALVLCVFSLSPARAHHSFAMFDFTKSVTLEGTVKEFAWTNPHAMLLVTAHNKEGEPEQAWSIELTSPGNLTRAGWNKRLFTPGDRIKVEIYPLRNGQPGGAFKHAVLVDSGTEISGPRDPTSTPPPLQSPPKQ